MSSNPPGMNPYLLENFLSFYEGIYSLDADTVAQLTSISLTSDPLQPLSGSPSDEASAAQPCETRAHFDDATQYSPPSPPEIVRITDAQEAEPPEHGSTSGGGKHSCKICGKTSKRLQEHERHVKEVHGLSTPQCPFCSYPWKRPYKIKKHLMEVHNDELILVLEGIRTLRGQGVVEFVETLEFVRNFKSETPETNASSPPTPFHAYGGYCSGSIDVVLNEDVGEGMIEEMTEWLEDM
ncbi:hypothetical protein BJY52DRAFT_627648 [Lactarius psammicola]|nr:hypothetical protein BJY52DRAFT_627648 [Lactarius psammicola]